MKRTQIDFSKHIVDVTKNGTIVIYHIHQPEPDTYTNSVKFINTSGIMAVTGDFGNWIFCREFHPSQEKVCDSYWCEKLSISSSQDPYEFDSDTAKEEIDEMLETDKNLSKEEKEWLMNLYDEADQGEYSYIAKAMDRPSSFESECIPRGKNTKKWLLAIFDAFDEICERMKEK